MSKDIFQKIIDGEVKSYKLYEDNEIIVILDAFPKTNGHSLVITKSSELTIIEENALNTSLAMEKAKDISRLLMDKMGASGTKITMNNYPDAGQEVLRTHIHVIPYYGEEKEVEELDSVYKKIML